jgi:peptidoglycan/LPS O-acetylase OafA/YrhL
MDSLLIGAAIALIPLPSKSIARWGLAITVPVYMALVLIGGNSFFTAPPIMLAGYTVLAVLYGSLLVLALHPGTFAERVMTVRPLRFLGKISYGLYLWHYLFSAQAEKLSSAIQVAIHPQVLGSLVAFAVTFGLSILIALASFHLIERPFLRLKDAFEPEGKKSVANAGLATELQRTSS